eukprot:799813-Rhodomonas_salina.2
MLVVGLDLAPSLLLVLLAIVGVAPPFVGTCRESFYNEHNFAGQVAPLTAYGHLNWYPVPGTG